MNNGIVDSKVHLLRAGESTSEFEILGVSIIAHLLAIPRLFSRKDLVELPGSTIHWFGRLYRHPGKMSGYQQAWIGKAFEYAVAELFNNRSEPYWSLICGGIDAALSTRVSPRVNQVSLDIERLSCVRVSRECADAEDLKREFGRCRILRDARRSAKHQESGLLPSQFFLGPGKTRCWILSCSDEARPSLTFCCT
jgi:hypothetical protein